MTQDSLPRSCLYACAALLWACSDPVTETAGTCYDDKIEYDCVQVVNCRISSGEPSLGGADPVGACIDRTAAQIASDPNGVATFLTNYGRCRDLQSCDFTTCATTGMHGYGELHQEKLTYDCQQKMACAMAMGTAVCDVNNAVINCVNESIGLLDSLSPEKRTAYEAAYAFCAPQIGCAFVDCFVY
jgi:hypothetical protein